MDDLTRWLRHRIGWEVGSAIENVVWSVGIALFLLCCCLASIAAVAWQILTRQ
jgi:hypothetical protein